MQPTQEPNIEREWTLFWRTSGFGISAANTAGILNPDGNRRAEFRIKFIDGGKYEISGEVAELVTHTQTDWVFKDIDDAKMVCEVRNAELIKQQPPTPPSGRIETMAKRIPTEEQAEMFPELNNSPEHKKIMKTAKALIEIREGRAEALHESKAQEDETQAALVEMLHAAGITKFRHESIEVEIKPRSEKVKAKMIVPDPEDE